MILTAVQLKERLEQSNIYGACGKITMTLNDTSVLIKNTDTIGNTIQEWLAQWLTDNGIFYKLPDSTQKFPDFFLSSSSTTNLLEVKSYVAKRQPAFDVANFDSYWQSLNVFPYRLDADYLIFAYKMEEGCLSISKIFLKKVWEITGKAGGVDLKCQRKKGQIYNIRPISFNGHRTQYTSFSCKEEFLAALYHTVVSHTNQPTETKKWLEKVIKGYQKYSGEDLANKVNGYVRR